MSTITAIAASWRTTSIGALKAIAGVVAALILLFGEAVPEPAVLPAWVASGYAILDGLSNVLSKDAVTTSEQAGLQ